MLYRCPFSVNIWLLGHPRQRKGHLPSGAQYILKGYLEYLEHREVETWRHFNSDTPSYSWQVEFISNSLRTVLTNPRLAAPGMNNRNVLYHSSQYSLLCCPWKTLTLSFTQMAFLSGISRFLCA